MGYAHDRNSYKLFDSKSQKLVLSRHVSFEEVSNSTHKTKQSPSKRYSTTQSDITLQDLSQPPHWALAQPSDSLTPVQGDISEEPEMADEAQPVVPNDGIQLSIGRFVSVVLLASAGKQLLPLLQAIRTLIGLTITKAREKRKGFGLLPFVLKWLLYSPREPGSWCAVQRPGMFRAANRIFEKITKWMVLSSGLQSMKFVWLR